MLELINQIKESFKNVRGEDIEWLDLEFILKHDAECTSCGNSLIKRFSDNYFEIDEHKDTLLCDDCHTEQNYWYCSCCENSVPNEYGATPNVDYYLHIGTDLAEEEGIKPGIYLVTEFPYFWSNYFDASLIPNTTKLIKHTNLNKVLAKIHGKHSGNVGQGDHICPDCALKYSGKKYIYTNYVSKNKVHMNINKRAAILSGCL